MDTESHVPHDHAVVHHGTKEEQGLEKPFTDPVCGMRVAADPQKEIRYEGQTYHFCSSGCMDRFRANPQAYVSPAKEEPAPVAPEGTIYTCPMHPEIRQPGPGSCPICGMALEPVMPALDEEENPELVEFRRRFWLTLPLTVIVTVLAMVGDRIFPAGLPGQSWIELALASPVILYAGWPFLVRWVQSIVRRSPNMWTLIGTGVAAAYGYSLVATVAPGLSLRAL